MRFDPKKFTAVILCWNEVHVCRHSVSILLQDGHNVVVVDNGSVDGSVDYWRYLASTNIPDFSYILLDKNYGSSVARNVGIDFALKRNPRNDIFLLDGDILYVQGTIPAYKQVMLKERAKQEELGSYPGVVGHCSPARLACEGRNGTLVRDNADLEMPDRTDIYTHINMVWCQYGLFSNNVLASRGPMNLGLRFVETPPFNGPGYGYEDDWFWKEMNASGYSSLALNTPTYYHDAHHGKRQLIAEQGVDTHFATEHQRAEVFEQRWGAETGWRFDMEKLTREQQLPKYIDYDIWSEDAAS